MDGSKQVRDPTLEVLKEISELLELEDPAIDLVLSLGTDEHHSWIYDVLGMKKLSSSSSSRKAAATRLHADVNKEKGRSYHDYHRFEVPDIRLGFRSKLFLREIADSTTRWLTEDTNRADIRRYAKTLVASRRARAGTPSWEGFALGIRYQCHYANCPKDTVFDTKGRFFKHLTHKHGLDATLEGGQAIEAELAKGRRIGYGLAL